MASSKPHRRVFSDEHVSESEDEDLKLETEAAVVEASIPEKEDGDLVAELVRHLEASRLGDINTLPIMQEYIPASFDYHHLNSNTPCVTEPVGAYAANINVRAFASVPGKLKATVIETKTGSKVQIVDERKETTQRRSLVRPGSISIVHVTPSGNVVFFETRPDEKENGLYCWDTVHDVVTRLYSTTAKVCDSITSCASTVKRHGKYPYENVFFTFRGDDLFHLRVYDTEYPHSFVSGLFAELPSFHASGYCETIVNNAHLARVSQTDTESWELDKIEDLMHDLFRYPEDDDEMFPIARIWKEKMVPEPTRGRIAVHGNPGGDVLFVLRNSSTTYNAYFERFSLTNGQRMGTVLILHSGPGHLVDFMFPDETNIHVISDDGRLYSLDLLPDEQPVEQAAAPVIAEESQTEPEAQPLDETL